MDQALQESYQECKRLNSLHGKTYYLATLLLPKNKRPYVHALYGFARYADEIVDDLASTLSPQEKADALRSWSTGVLEDLKKGTSTDHIGRALVDTARKFDIPHQHFVDFLHSMEMDLTVTEYQDYDALLEYVYGSAAVIGLEMVPVLGYSDQRAFEAAKKLGIAFQLANFIRDVSEDLARFGVNRAMLERRVLTPEIVEALKFQIARVRSLQDEADVGIAYLDKTSRPCIRAASELYCGIVDEVEAIGYDVFNKRAKTSTGRRARVAGAAYLQAIAARIR